MKFLLLFCLALLTSQSARAQYYSNYLTVSDVRQSWYTKPGTIEAATLSVRPKGIYMEYGLYLTFSARGANFNTYGDSLEVVLNFTLPENAIVHDSWLWIGEDIVKARILDRWSASTIYEGVVKRRTDPSILVKNSSTQYQLRVFPMAKNSTRKVKITWLQPAEFYSTRTESPLPLPILTSSFNTVSQFDVLVWSDDRFQSPTIANHPELAFEAVSDTTGGNFYRTTLTPDQYGEDLRLRFASPMQNGYYLGTYSEGGEKFYQLAVMPSSFLPVEQHRKVACLFDYEVNTGAPNTTQLFTAAKNALLNNLEPSDSFNLFCSNLVIQKAANRWLPAHPDTITQAFASMANSLATYSNLQPLLLSGIQWVQAKNTGGNILLISNSSQFANLTAANALLNDLLNLVGPSSLPINVVDYNRNYYPYFYANGIYYYANSYLLSNLAALSGGTYLKPDASQSLSKAVDAGISNLGANLEAFDLYTSVDNGFCYGKFNVGATSNTINISRPVLQVGKYIGEAPFHFEINGIYHNQALHSENTVLPASVLTSDTLMREMWYGRFVQSLENEPSTSSTISSIIFHSLAERVLSKYTAFLCLDNPSWICEDCEDESQFTSTDDLNARDSLLTAFPNPFANRTTVKIQASSNSGEHLSFEIYNLQAQLVRRFDLGSAQGENSLDWDGTDLGGKDVPAGIYLGLLKMGDQMRVLKLVKIRQ